MTLYAPVTDPGFRKNFPSWAFTLSICVCPEINTSHSSSRWYTLNASRSPHGITWCPWISPKLKDPIVIRCFSGNSNCYSFMLKVYTSSISPFTNMAASLLGTKDSIHALVALLPIFPVHNTYSIFPGTKKALNCSGMPWLFCGIWRSPRTNTV